jgi:hypothetical protein
MSVTRRQSESRPHVVAGVVAKHLDPDEAREALDELARRGFMVTTLRSDMLIDGIAALKGPSDLELLAKMGVAESAVVSSQDLVLPVAAAAAALTRSFRVQLAEQQKSFDAVVDAVTRPTVPSPAWFAQARRNAEARSAFLDEFGALTSEDIAAAVGSRATNRRATAHRWQAEGKIFAVNHHGQVLYPVR